MTAKAASRRVSCCSPLLPTLLLPLPLARTGAGCKMLVSVAASTSSYTRAAIFLLQYFLPLQAISFESGSE